MTELPIEKPVMLATVEGRVFILRVDGTLESGRAGIALHAGDRLLGDDEGTFTLVEPSVPLNQQYLVANQNIGPVEAGSEPDPGLLDALRQKILAGGDPTELFEPAAVATTYMAENYNPNGPSSSQGPFTVIDRNNGSTLANAGFDTEHNNKIDNMVRQQVAGYDASPDGEIQEEIPLSIDMGATTLAEDAFTRGAAVVGESRFLVKHGTDPLLVDSLLFSNQSQTLATLNGAALGSDGHPLTFEFADDRTLLGYYLDGNGLRVEVLRAELVAEQQGSDVGGRVVVTLTGPLDHQGSDSISLGLQVSASEIDGDATSANLKIAINDGRDPALSSDQGVALQEGIHRSAEGQLPVTVGSDRLVSLNFEPNQPALAGLTSQGKATTYEVHGNQLIVKDWQGEAILTVTIGLDGKYSVSLIGVFDEPVATGRLDLALHVEGRDLDGDKSNLGTLTIKIVEGEKPILTLTDVMLGEGRLDDTTSATDDQQGSGQLTIKSGSDPVVDVRLTLSGQVVDAGGKAVTHNGETLSWQAVGTDGHTFQAVTSAGLVVMTVTLPLVPAVIGAHSSATIDYKVTVHTNLDQGADNQLDLTLPVQITDSDGSQNQGTATITVSDSADPALGLDQGVALQEGIHRSAEGQLPVTVGSDRLASLNFEPSQPALAGLTSQGKATTYEVHDNQLIVKDWQGEAILTVTIGLDGKYSVSLTGDFDEPVDTARLDLALHVEGRDLDGDKSNPGTLNITITDAPQMIAPVSLILTEDSDWQQGQTLSGSLVVTATSDALVSITFDATQPDMQGLTSGQQAVAITVADHLIEGRTPDGKLVFELILGDDGNYSFTLHQPLDQVVSDSILNSHFTAQFASGAEASSTYSVIVVDGVDPGISYGEMRMASIGTGIVEISLGEEPATTIQSFGVIHGSDALDPNSLSFDIVAISRALSGLSSHGSAVSFSLEPNGHLIGVSADGRIILRAELSMVADANGNWLVSTQVTLSGQLDHAGREPLALPLAIAFSDMDGDKSSFSVPFHIADGALPTVIAGSGIAVFFSEDGLSPVAPRTATGSFIVWVGSDRLAEVSFADSALQPALSAQGKPIQYEIADGDPALPGSQLLKGYVVIDGQRVEVFEIQLSGSLDQTGQSQVSYQCTLYTGMDQDASRVLSLPLVVNIRDYDHGGSSTTVMLEIIITGDELPVVNMSPMTLQEGVFDALSGSSDDQIVKGALTISTVADPVVQVQLFMSGELVNQDYTPLTHNGEVITWQPVGTTGHLFQGVTASGVVVVTVELLNVPARLESNTTQSLEYQVTLHTNVDHMGGFGDEIQLPISVETRDSDGNSWVTNSYVHVTDGSHPVITTVEAVTVNEAALDGGAGQYPGTHAADTGESASGQFVIAAGSDRVATYEIDVDEFMRLNKLYSTSVDRAYSWDIALVALAQPGHYMGFATTMPFDQNGSLGPAYDRPIFYITLDPAGHYTFTLVAALNHLLSSSGVDEPVVIKLPLFVTDHDGDRSAIRVVEVTVLDDMPAGANVVHTLGEGEGTISGSLLPMVGADGSFSGQGLIATKLTINGVDYGFGVEVAVPSPDGSQVIGQLVVNQDGSYRFTANALDHSNTSISQDIRVELLDSDGDAVDSTITLNLQDTPIQFVVNPAQGPEDTGIAPLPGIPIVMDVNIGDFDRGEFIESLLIEAPVNMPGTFIYNWMPLGMVMMDGKTWYHVPVNAMQSSDGVNYTLSGVEFIPVQDWNSDSNGGQPLYFDVRIQVGVKEGAALSPITGELTIDVQAVNDAPVNLHPASFTINEDQVLTLSGIRIEDIDAGLNPVSVTLRVAHGALIVTAVAGAVTVQGSATGELILQGPLDEINTLLASQVYYQPDRDFWGQDTLDVITSDLGNSGLGGVLTATDTVPIYVTGQPDLPLLALEYHTVMTLPGTPGPLVPLLLDASVVNGMPGELSVRIAGLNGAIVVDAAGNQLGSDLGADGWLLPMDQDIPLFISGLADGDQRLTLQAESSNGMDLLTSTSEELAIHVGGGKDVSGSQGNELLLGDDNGNVLKGEAGNDLLIGGGGSDLFLWSQGDAGEINAPAQDVITDFNLAEGDVIHVAGLLSGVSDTSIDELLKFVDFKVSDAEGGLKNINMSLSPLGDGNITQQISLNNVDLSMFAGSSDSEILKSLVDNNNICVRLDVNAM